MKRKIDFEFLQQYRLKTMSFDTQDIDYFTAIFETIEGRKIEITISREKVMSHIRKTCNHLEMYEKNKKMVIAHFKRMAKILYVQHYVSITV